MPIIPTGAHLKRYRDIAMLLLKHGRHELVDRMGLSELLHDDEKPGSASGHDRAIAELPNDLQRLGPTFVKFGQLLASRADLLPLPYLQALSRLQDQCDAMPFEDVERTLKKELKLPLDRAFDQFEREPLAAASLGQVHRAVLPGGRPVAVKVQRRGIEDQMSDDLEAIGQVCHFLEDHTDFGRRMQLRDMLAQFKRALTRELDYEQEAANLKQMAKNMASFDRLVIPSAVDDYTTPRVLTMDYIHGRRVTSIGPLTRTEIDADGLVEELFHAYLHQVLVDGFFHADPHPGNVFLMDDGRVALIDVGMVGHLSPRMRERLMSLLLATSEGRSEDAAEVAIEMGIPWDEFDRTRFRQQITRIVMERTDVSVSKMAIGRMVLEVAQAAGANGLKVPTEIAMLGKSLMHLDEVARELSPKFDPNAAIRRHMTRIFNRRLWQDVSPAAILSSLIEAKEFVHDLPRRVSSVLDALADNDLRLRIDAIDEDRLIQGLQKIANRITVGLVLGALILGAAILFDVETQVTGWGFPVISTICFLGAAALGFFLVITTLWSDRRGRRKRRR